MKSLDKDNPAEDFYEKKHLNSDLICTNFTELTDNEFYECLKWANTKLMENYYNKQRDNTLSQIQSLYDDKDVTFRGFRQQDGNNGQGSITDKVRKTKQDIFQGNEVLDGMVNWEATSSDGDRFNLNVNSNTRRKGLACFEEYLKKKEKRKQEKNQEKIKKAQEKSNNLKETSQISSQLH